MPNVFMIGQETTKEHAGNQSIYCQWNYTRTSHTDPGTFDVTKSLNEVD
jgi:hypothetical protein